MHGVPACVWEGARQARAPHPGARPMRPARPAASHAHAKRTYPKHAARHAGTHMPAAATITNHSSSNVALSDM